MKLEPKDTHVSRGLRSAQVYNTENRNISDTFEKIV